MVKNEVLTKEDVFKYYPNEAITLFVFILGVPIGFLFYDWKIGILFLLYTLIWAGWNSSLSDRIRRNKELDRIVRKKK